MRNMLEFSAGVSLVELRGRDVRATLFSIFFSICILFSTSCIFADSEQKKDVNSYTLSAEKYQQAIHYARAKYIIYFVSSAYGLILAWMRISRRVGSRFRTWAENISHRRFLQVIIITPLIVLTLAILSLPIEIYRQVLALKYAQSVQTWGSWFWDWAKVQLIGCFILSILVWILYGIIRRSPRRWWFYYWLASLPIIVFILFVSPVLIDPLFFKFESLEKKAPVLVEQIEKVVNHGGLTIPRERMFFMNASEKLNSLNAYVTGFGSSKRVVVWDTTISKMTVPQILYVFGHEMGHYVLHHIIKGLIFAAVLIFVFLFLGYRYTHSLISKYGIGWDIRGVDDYASLTVFIFLLSLFGFIATPVISNFTRIQEHQADIYGLEVIHGIIAEPQKAAAEAFQILGEVNLSDPNPNAFIKFWLYDHPPLNERLQFVRNYDPWSKGEPPKYVP